MATEEYPLMYVHGHEDRLWTIVGEVIDGYNDDTWIWTLTSPSGQRATLQSIATTGAYQCPDDPEEDGDWLPDEVLTWCMALVRKLQAQGRWSE